MRKVEFSGLLASLAMWTGVNAADLHDFDWSSVEPSTRLNYTSCYDGHKCAKLQVPLDWLDTSNPKQVTLAIIARPATVDESDPDFGGTIITNPGGPSGSGVNFVLRLGEVLQNIADGSRKFEILSFDPRGVGFTTPSADCFRDEFARSSFQLQSRVIGDPGASIDNVKMLFSRSDGFGNLCDDSESIRGFMSTSSVARDMVEIVDKLHEARQGNTALEQAGSTPRIELRSGKDDTPRIQYWGFSYGTVLGRYFASMFPGRVGRIILEAVEDVHDYANATWSGNLVDVQKAYEYLWEICYEAGSRCDLYHSADEGPDDIRDRVTSFMNDLDTSPVPYVDGNRIVTITKQDVIDTIFQSLYSPERRFPEISEAIAAAMQGNYTRLYEGLDMPGRTFSCPVDPKLDTYTWSTDAQAAIACGDSEPQTNLTVSQFQAHWENLRHDSLEFATYWSKIRLACKGWRIRPKYRFTGPWVTPEADPSLVKGKPAAPILFVSSTIDPVTPLRMAKAAREGHPGSGLLVQANVGHGTVGTAGQCRDNYINKYLEHGETPPEGLVCEPDCKPFFDCPHAKAIASTMWRDGPWSPLGVN